MRRASRPKLIQVHMLAARMQIALTLRLIKDIVAYAMKGSQETPISKMDAKVNWLLGFGMISNSSALNICFRRLCSFPAVSRHVFAAVLVFFRDFMKIRFIFSCFSFEHTERDRAGIDDQKRAYKFLVAQALLASYINPVA